MSISRGIQVQIPCARQEGTSIGGTRAVFGVHVFEGLLNHVVELDDSEIAFLHEQLSHDSRDVPALQGFKWRLFESAEFIEERRRVYEKFLNDTLSSAACVNQCALWVALGVDAGAATAHRFLIRGDNITQLEELSVSTENASRLANAGMMAAIARLIQERPHDIKVVSSGTTVLLRVLSKPDSVKLLTESNVIPVLLRCLFQSAEPVCIQVLTEAALALVAQHPQSLFWYFQRDNGLTEMIDMIDTSDSNPAAIHGLSSVIWTGVTQSRDVELAVTDKSSVGMSLLNKLLVKGQGTESEVITTCVLAFLFVRGQVPEYSQKIRNIIHSVVSTDSGYGFKFRFIENGPRFLHLLGKPDTPVLPELEEVFRLACFVIVSKCLRDPTYFDRTQTRGPLTKRLKQIIFTGSEVSELTRTRCAEALVIIGGPDVGGFENLSNALEMEKYIYSLNASLITEKIQKLNNFFIEANFDLSSRVVGDPIGSEHSSTLSYYAEQMDDLVKSIDAEQTQLQLIHTRALNEVVSGMFQIKSLLKEIEAVSSTADLSKEAVVSEIEANAVALRGIETELADTTDKTKQEELMAKARELKVAIMESPGARELNAKRSSILKTIRSVDIQVMTLNSETFASLVEAVKQIETRSESTHVQTGQLKILLLKMKNQIDDLLEQLDSDSATSSPVSP